MDQSQFHSSWLALLALSKGCVPSCFHHMCHGLTFSVSPIGAGLCSCQQAAFEVHLSSVGTKTASNQWRFRFQAHLFDHAERLPDFQDCAEAHVDAKLAEIAFHRATVASWLTLWGRLHLPLMGLLKCQFWDGWGLSTPPSWDKKLWSTQNQAEISRPKIKFGDLPRWVRSCLKQKPTQSWKFPLHSCEPNDLVPCEPSKGGLGGS